MLLLVVVFLVVSWAGAGAQEQAMSTVPPAPPPPFPLLDLLTGSSNYYPDVRKTYPDSHAMCPKSDGLSSLANILGSIAKITLSVAVVVFLKLLGGKLLLFPLTIILFAKLGLKAVLLWPMISKMIKYFKKKKKKGHKSRSGRDCSERIACVVQRASRNGWSSHLGAATAFTMIDDVDDDSALAKILLTMLSGDNVAKCMTLECTSGIDIS